MNERFIEEVLSLLPKGSSSFPKEAITIALKTALDGKKVYVDTEAKTDLSNDEAMELFLASKSLEGCSNRTTLLPEFFVIVVILLNQIPSFFLISLGMAFLLTMKSITL